MDNRNLIEISQKIIESTEEETIIVERLLNEDDDSEAEKYIKVLIKTKWSGSNKEQMKAVQLLKGLAVNDSDAANKFMQMLDAAATKYGNKS